MAFEGGSEPAATHRGRQVRAPRAAPRRAARLRTLQMQSDGDEDEPHRSRPVEREGYDRMGRVVPYSKGRRTLLWILFTTAVLTASLWWMGRRRATGAPLVSLRAPRPRGVGSGEIRACPSGALNCVTTVDSGDGVRDTAYAPPWAYPVGMSPDEAYQRVREVILHFPGRERATLILERPDRRYLYAEFQTPVLGFVDDVELRIDAPSSSSSSSSQPGTVQYRSASRIGRSDRGANRARLAWILQELRKQGFRPVTEAQR